MTVYKDLDGNIAALESELRIVITENFYVRITEKKISVFDFPLKYRELGCDEEVLASDVKHFTLIENIKDLVVNNQYKLDTSYFSMKEGISKNIYKHTIELINTKLGIVCEVV